MRAAMKDSASASVGAPPPANHQFVDIHPAPSTQRQMARQQQPPPFNGSVPVKRAAFNRQMSLETGVSALGVESRGARGGVAGSERLLSRSGKSLGGGGGVGRTRGDFSMFRTKSTLSKQSSSMLPLRKDSDIDLHSMDGGGGGGGTAADNSVNKSVPAGRYFAALRGPELDQVRDSEDILLPKDERWPFLLRFPIGCYGICLGLGSQSILWSALSTTPAVPPPLRPSPVIPLLLWLLALATLLSVTATYALKCLFYFEAVRREYFHPVRANFFFAPWIASMFLSIAAPPSLFHPHPALWCAFMPPVLALELKIYGQWLSGGKRRLCKVANPSTHLSVVGNFVGAILAAKVGWLEPAKFLWAVGFAHYLVVFVTLYQRLPTNEALPKELHPVYSMFIAAPSAASIAWAGIYGEFDEVSRTCYFIALFLYTSLVVRINFFRGFRFSVAWWSYTFPMTTASLATIKYAEAVPCFATRGLAMALSAVSSTMVSVLLVSTLLHGFVWRTLFPNDVAIAITKKKVTSHAQAGRERKSAGKNRAYDIKRWAKHHSPMALVAAMGKGGNNGSVVVDDKSSSKGEII